MRGASPSGSNRVLGRPRAEALIGAAALSGGPCVVDASLIGQGLPLDRQAIKQLCGVDLEPRILAALEPDEDGEVDRGARDAAAGSVLELVRSAQAPVGWEHDEWIEYSRSLSSVVEEARHEVPRLRVLESEQPSLIADLGSEFDELSLSAASVELIEHGQAVGALARATAQSIGLSDALAEVVEQAGVLHDIGKADERFQRWLDPENQHSELLAKSATPRHRWEATRAASGLASRRTARRPVCSPRPSVARTESRLG